MPRKCHYIAEPYNEVFPRRLRQLIEQRQTTQQDLASALGRTRQMIGYYADGSSVPPLDTIVAICEYFHVSSDWLLGLTDTQSPAPSARSAQEYTGLSETALSTLSSETSAPDSKRPLSLGAYRNIVSGLLESTDFYEFCCDLYNYEKLYLTCLAWEAEAHQKGIPEEEYYRAVTDRLDSIGLGGLYLSEVCSMYRNTLDRSIFRIIRSIEAKLTEEFEQKRRDAENATQE